MHWVIATALRVQPPVVRSGRDRQHLRTTSLSHINSTVPLVCMLLLDIDRTGAVKRCRPARRQHHDCAVAVNWALGLSFTPAVFRGRPVAYSGLRFRVTLGSEVIWLAR